VGLEVAEPDWALIVRLMRPMALLGILSLLRFGFALGTLEVNIHSIPSFPMSSIGGPWR